MVNTSGLGGQQSHIGDIANLWQLARSTDVFTVSSYDQYVAMSIHD